MGNTYKKSKKEFDNDNTPKRKGGMKIINDYIEDDFYEEIQDEFEIHDTIHIEKQ